MKYTQRELEKVCIEWRKNPAKLIEGVMNVKFTWRQKIRIKCMCILNYFGYRRYR